MTFLPIAAIVIAGCVTGVGIFILAIVLARASVGAPLWTCPN